MLSRLRIAKLCKAEDPQVYRLYQRYINSINSRPCGPSSSSDLNDSKPEEAVNIHIILHYRNYIYEKDPKCEKLFRGGREFSQGILQQNTFEFAARHFRQIKGVAMGIPVAPRLANLFMGKVEKDALTAWMGTQPLVWLRYIDDILLILEDTHLVLAELLTHLNARISSIKFTEEHSYNSIDFLDLTLFKGPRFAATGIIDIKPFAKLIDPHAYLHFSSEHHRSVIMGLVKDEFVRTLRRNSSPEIYASAVTDLTDWFLNRGYSKHVIRAVADKVSYGDRDSFLQNSTNRSLPECTTILSVRNHPAIKSADLKEALTDIDLPFCPLVTWTAPASVSGLIVKAGTPSTADAVRYHLRSSEVCLTKEQFLNYVPPSQSPPPPYPLNVLIFIPILDPLPGSTCSQSY